MDFSIIKAADLYPYGEEAGRYNCGDECGTILYRNTDEREFRKFIGDIKARDDWKPWQENALKDNLFFTFTGERGMLHATYTAYSKKVRLVFDTLKTNDLPSDAPQTYEKVTEPTLCVMALDYSHRDVTDGNGMSYVFILADGSYLIYDGGYPQDTDNLYGFLRDNCRRPDGKIVIAAWIFTHAHYDHYGNFENFTDKYADQVRVEQFVCNPVSAENLVNPKANDPYLEVRFPERIRSYSGARLVRMHTGQRLAVRDAVVEAWLCAEDLFSEQIHYLNEVSLVTKVYLAGQSILLLADAEIVPDKILPQMYGDALKSDIFQVAHHGYSGGNEELFRDISPRIAMWTTSQAAFDIRISDAWPRPQNRFLTREMLMIERYLVADGDCKLIRLPYNGEEPEHYTYR